MASSALRILRFSQNLEVPILHQRKFHISVMNNLDQRWRAQKGLPMNQNAYGVLTDSPDYTFLDGRATPYGVNQRKRMVKQKQLADKIIKYVNEIDFAVERHQKLQIEKREKRQQILQSKLKAKGTLLLSSTNNK